MANQIKPRLIAIDTEYHTDSIGRIDKVFCICALVDEIPADAHNATSEPLGRVFKRWLCNTTNEAISSQESPENRFKNDYEILDEIASYFGITDPIFVCHAFDKAERRALEFLGVDTAAYKFVDTFHLARMLTFNMDKVAKKVYESDAECISDAAAAKEKKLSELSYAGLCNKYQLGLVDTQRKEFMRQLCIQDNTGGYEAEILDYCADDTKYLIPLLDKLFSQYCYYLGKSFCPMFPKFTHKLDVTDDKKKLEYTNWAINCLIAQSRYISYLGKVADRGIPLDASRVEKVKTNAIKYREHLKAEFNRKYPRTYLPEAKSPTLKRNVHNVQYYIYQEIKHDNKLVNSYPKTSTGKLSTSQETLKEWFKSNPESFGERYRQNEKLIAILNKVSGDKDNPLDSIYGGKLWYESLEPYASKTTRNQPRKKFIFGWHKSLYGLMSPAKGKWLVELDYSSEETFIQACICRDKSYYNIYASKDIYLSFAALMGLIPKSEFDALSVDELKHKYKSARSLIKPMILGLSYGMGVEKLAQSLGIKQELAECYIDKIKRIIRKTTEYKASLCEAYMSGKYQSICTPDGAICHVNPRNYKATTLINYPFQSAGGMILRHLVRTIETDDGCRAKLLATIHDAIFFEVDEGDHAAIEHVKQLMIVTANKLLSAPAGWTIKVGEPEIVKYGEVWTPEHAFDRQFQTLLEYGDSLDA